MIKIEVTVIDVGMGVVVEIKGGRKDPTAREQNTADKILEILNADAFSGQNSHKIYEHKTDNQQEASPRPAHADWVDEALAELEKAQEEGVLNAGSN